MTDLITRLKKLSGPNPVVQVKLTADDAEAVERLVEDVERYRWLRECSPVRSDRHIHVEQSLYENGRFIGKTYPDHGRLDAAIDSARTPTKETT